MPADLASLAWPAGALGEAITALARAAGFAPRPGQAPAPIGVDLDDEEAIAGFLAHAAAELGVEAEPVSARALDLRATLRALGPALLRLPGQGPPRFLALLGRAGRELALLAPDGASHPARAEALAALLTAPLEAPLLPEISALLTASGVRGPRLDRARRALLDERLGVAGVEGLWLLRLPPHGAFLRHLREAGLLRRALLVLGAHAAAYALLLLAWWTAGRAVLEDRLDRGWLWAWALLLFTIVPFRLLASWSAGRFSFDAGALLKQRLLAGALALPTSALRREGAGRLLGRVLESEAIEGLALGGGVTGATGLIELLASALVLVQGPAPLLLPLLLVAWAALSLALALAQLRAQTRWTDARLGLTHDLVERMVGHRTRLAQEAREAWHRGEDEALDHYLAASRRIDRSALALRILPRAFLVLGVLGLAPALASGRATSASMAIGLGGVLLASAAFGRVVTGLASLIGAAIAWRQAAPLFHAADPIAPTPSLPPPRIGDRAPGARRSVLEAQGLVFRHRPLGRPVIAGASLQIAAGDRVLLEGASGGGKSTLGALLSGLREPEEGLLLLDGFDRGALGASAWRRRVAAAPQFHENHVLTGSFAFNLLMGRRWPPTPADVAEAEALCRELGLGELIARMPGGLEQMVGETGWQLSQGEKSRLYLARALLQGAELVVLDESFAALDPATLKQALGCVMARAPALLVIAHP